MAHGKRQVALMVQSAFGSVSTGVSGPVCWRVRAGLSMEQTQRRISPWPR